MEKAAAQRRASIFGLALVPLLACSAAFERSGGADASAPASSSTSQDAGGAQGIGCATDPDTGAVLCASISLCPSVTVDPDRFPRCGFRIRGNVLDLECGCDRSLCPMGVPVTCQDAANLLADQTSLGVCTQLPEGRCTSMNGGGASGGETPSTCDRQCVTQCGGGSACATLCGC